MPNLIKHISDVEFITAFQAYRDIPNGRSLFGKCDAGSYILQVRGDLITHTDPMPIAGLVNINLMPLETAALLKKIFATVPRGFLEQYRIDIKPNSNDNYEF